MTRKPNLPRYDNGKLVSYAWPGGYPVLYLDAHNNVLCPDCANEAEVDPDELESWKPSAYGVHYEGHSEFCVNCNTEIESAYGEPDAENN